MLVRTLDAEDDIDKIADVKDLPGLKKDQPKSEAEDVEVVLTSTLATAPIIALRHGVG